MAKPSAHINYSFEDIQRYLQDKMSAGEMHAIEKAALQDSFLADAIEGYAGVSATKAKLHLDEINAALFNEKKESKVVAFNRKTQWIDIAALIIILAGIGVVSAYFFKSSNQQAQVAQVKKEAAAKTQAIDSTNKNLNAPLANADTSLLIAQNKDLKKVKSKENRQSTKKVNPTKEDIVQDESPASVMNMAPAMVQQNETASRVFENADVYASKNDSIHNLMQGKASWLAVLPGTFTGKVIDESNKPVPYVSIESADKKTVVLTDANGNFTLQKNDTILNVTASSVAYEQQKVNLQPGHNNTIILKEYKPDLNDVVVVGYGTKRKRNAFADSVTRVQGKLPSDSAMPIGGWNNFNNYVLTQLDKDSTSTGVNNPDDLVELEFLIDNNGEPYNIKVIKPLDDQHNAKAIEIIKNGPKWTKPAKKKKAKVSISF